MVGVMLEKSYFQNEKGGYDEEAIKVKGLKAVVTHSMIRSFMVSHNTTSLLALYSLLCQHPSQNLIKNLIQNPLQNLINYQELPFERKHR